MSCLSLLCSHSGHCTCVGYILTANPELLLTSKEVEYTTVNHTNMTNQCDHRDRYHWFGAHLLWHCWLLLCDQTQYKFIYRYIYFALPMSTPTFHNWTIFGTLQCGTLIFLYLNAVIVFFNSLGMPLQMKNKILTLSNGIQSQLIRDVWHPSHLATKSRMIKI